MFWSDDTDTKSKLAIPDDIVDIAYKLECKALPLDHAWSLSQALQQVLPWLAEDTQAGIHLIHGAESGNGWYRPDDPENDVLYLSRRTRMTLRISKERIDDAQDLTGKTLDIAGNALTVGEASIKLLSNLPTLFARYVICEQQMDEHQFLTQAARQLRAMGIPVNKLMAGKQTVFRMPQALVITRSLMVADLKPEHSIRLQQQGLGEGRKFGCGLFLPQKGITPVNSEGSS